MKVKNIKQDHSPRDGLLLKKLITKSMTNIKRLIAVLLVLHFFSLVKPQQKILLYDELLEKNITNTPLIFNGEVLKTDENGVFVYQKSQPINTIKIKGFEEVSFEQNQEPFLRLSVFKNAKQIEEIILKKQEYITFSNFKNSFFSFSLRNDATLLNYFKVTKSIQNKKLKSITISFSEVNENCGKIYLKPVIYNANGNMVGGEVASSYELYEIDHSNLSQILTFSEPIELKNTAYFVGFRLYNMKECDRPYRITSKLMSSNPAYFKLTHKTEWFENRSINKKYINFGYTLHLY